MAEDEADPSTPPAAPEFLPADVALPRIEAIVANARTVWLGQIGFLAFITLTLVSTRDVDFFSVTATTDLPIINVAIPTTTFFWTAAWLAAVLHTYLHLFLLRLWDALAEAPAELDGLRLGERVFPWLVNDWALRLRPDRPLETRPMDWLANTVTLVLVWLGTPLVLIAFWWRSMPAHDAWLTLAIAGALGLSLFASANGWHRAKARLSNPGKLAATSSGAAIGLRSVALPPRWRHAGIVLGIALLALSLLRTEIGSVPVGSFRYDGFLLAPIDLVGAEIAVRPDDWRDHELARRRFRIAWCDDNGLTPLACEPTGSEGPARADWCESNGIDDCPARFRKIDDSFAGEWAEERQADLDGLIKPNLRGRDLRQASASGAFLAGVDLREARLEGANLSGARLEGAYLGGAWLEGADLFEARLEGANLFEARLEGAELSFARLQEANLGEARLEGAYFNEARLEGADLSGARLEGADLSWARLEGADLSEARLEGAYLREARLEGANLREARLQSADWAGATLGASTAQTADFTGGWNLTQTQLAEVIGDDDTILPLDAETGEQLYVWSCWSEPPATLNTLLKVYPDFMREDVKGQWLCAEGEAPRKVGTPAEAAAPSAD